MARNINQVTLTGNLTRDPEVRSTQSGTVIANLRIASNTGRKNQQTGQWEDKPNYIDVVVFGNQAQSCGQYLHKGSAIAVNGELSWSEWEAKDGSGKRQKLEVVANMVQFLHSAPPGGYQQQPGGYPQGQAPPPQQQPAPAWAAQPPAAQAPPPGYPPAQQPPPQGAPPQQPPPQQTLAQGAWTPPPVQQQPPPQGQPPAGLPMDQGGKPQGEDDIPF